MRATVTEQKIPIIDLKAQYQTIQSEVEEAVIRVLRSGHYVLGPELRAFEQEASKFLGLEHCIGCANGSDALYLALLALDIKPGDEVITTAFTYIATAEAISQIGAVPVFADINLDTFNIDPKSIEKKITNKTKAIIVVHLFGQACEMQSIKELADAHNLKIIEDVAQAFGTKYQGKCVGGFGDIGTFSFYPTKNLSCAGDGGMLSTQSEELAERLRKIRVHGSSRRYYHDELGVNSRLDEIQAAILRIKLKHIASWNQRRAELAAEYDRELAALAEIKTPTTIADSTHIYHQYTIRTDKRDELKSKLADNGVSSEIYYPLPLHKQNIYSDYAQQNDLVNSEEAARTVLSLPIYPELETTRVVSCHLPLSK